MSQFVTAFNAAGQSTFSPKIKGPRNARSLPIGELALLYSTYSMPLDISSEADIDQYAIDRVQGLPPNTPCPANGTSVFELTLAPNAVTPLRRTLSLGVCVIIEGNLLMSLDSGEEQHVTTGDVVVMRSPLYSFRNLNEKSAKFVMFSQDIKSFEINGKPVSRQI